MALTNGGFVEPFHEHMKGVATFKTRLSYKAVMVKAGAGVAGYLGITKWGASYIVRCTAENYEQAIGFFDADELGSPLPQASMFLYKVHGLPWDVGGSGIAELFKKAGLPKPTMMGAPYSSKNTRGFSIAVAEEITQLRITMAKGAHIFLTAKGGGKGKDKGNAAQKAPSANRLECWAAADAAHATQGVLNY